MSKAILITDMPKIDKDTKKGCKNCKYGVARMTLSEEYLCNLTGQAAYVYKMECPLQPMPNRRKRLTKEEYIDDLSDWYLGYIDGYNECIDEITEEV